MDEFSKRVMDGLEGAVRAGIASIDTLAGGNEAISGRSAQAPYSRLIRTMEKTHEKSF